MESKKKAQKRMVFEKEVKALLTGNDVVLKDYFNFCELSEEDREKHDFSCPICLCLVYKPVTCAQCENHLYCSECINKTVNQECPFCKKSSFKDIHKMLKGILNSTKVVCSQGGNCCNPGGLVEYGNLTKHYSDCVQKPFACPFYCGMMIQPSSDLSSVLSHYDKCQKVEMECPLCGCEHVLSQTGLDPMDCIANLNREIDEKDKRIQILKSGEKFITCLDDYDWNEMNMGPQFSQIMQKDMPSSNFVYTKQTNKKDELEYRPTYTCDSKWGQEFYQGQWLKGTNIYAGFGQRSWINIKKPYNSWSGKEWFEKGYYQGGKMTGYGLQTWWYDNQFPQDKYSYEWYLGQIKLDKRVGPGTYFHKKDGKRETKIWAGE